MKKSCFRNILFVTLTNIGDAILTTPILGLLIKHFPEAEISVMASPAAANLFERNPRFKQVITYDKLLSFKGKLSLLFKIRRQKFDVVIDLKNTFFSLFSGAKYRTPLFRHKKSSSYRKDIFLKIFKSAFRSLNNLTLDIEGAPFYIWSSEKDKTEAEKLLESCSAQGRNLVAICPFAKSDTKSWPGEYYAEVINRLNSTGKVKIVLIGSKEDTQSCRHLQEKSRDSICNLCGKTSLRVLAEILKKCRCLVANDSAPMHLAVAVGTPVVAIFGPTDPKKYAPQGEEHTVVAANLACQPCEKAQCLFGNKPANCLTKISVDTILEKVKKII